MALLSMLSFGLLGIVPAVLAALQPGPPFVRLDKNDAVRGFLVDLPSPSLTAI